MYIKKSKKIVIKIGLSILVDKKGKPKKKWLEGFVKDIKFLFKKKNKLLLFRLVQLHWDANILKLVKRA